jgi:asparagine synthase (glutamine-hydrolysing)
MCGISAVLSLGGYPAQSNGEHLSSLEEQLSKSLDLVQHRGPDARGEWASDDGDVRMCFLPLK